MNDNTTIHIKPFKDTKVTCMKWGNEYMWIWGD